MSQINTVAWIVGCPQSGKTTLARVLAARRRAERGVPVLVLDSALVHNFTDVPLHTIEEARHALWREPRGSCRIAPSSLDDVDRMCRAVQAGKDCIVLVDEAHFWLSAQSGVSSELTKLMRATQHARVDLYLTTQHLTGDVPQTALSCTSDLYVFRCTAPRVLQTLEREFSIPRETAGSLPQWSYIERRIGF